MRAVAVGLDPDQVAARRREPEEVARPAAGLEHPALLEAEVYRCGPQRFDDLGRGVVRVEGRSTCFGPGLLASEQLPRSPAGLDQVVTLLVEQLGQSAPARPAGEDRLVLPAGDTVVAERCEGLEGGEVRRELRLRPGRSQVGLTGGPERYGAVSVQSRSSRLSWSLIRARSAALLVRSSGP